MSERERERERERDNERERERERGVGGRACVCVRANMSYRPVFTLFTRQKCIYHFNYYDFKLLLIFLLVDELLSLYYITDL